jgi:putative GTP pyrophosphokinase
VGVEIGGIARPSWVSKGRVNRAGDALRDGHISGEDASCLDAWRASHRYILNTFQAILRNRTKGKGIIVAQRLKRRITIADKMNREPHMRLARMDDVAGCRLIFQTLTDLYSFREEFHKIKFKHRRKNHEDKYNYIINPKPLGYRGIHDIYEYDSMSIKGRPHKGLLLELQYRTLCQHAWSTSVELITHFTGHEPKFNRGDIKHIEFFKLTSELLARTKEGMTSCYPSVSNTDLVDRITGIDSDLHLLGMLRRMQPSVSDASDASSLVLQISEDGNLTIHELPTRSDAIGAYFRLEKEYPRDDIVLVRADTFQFIRTAYRNYFSDVEEFITFVDQGCRDLSNLHC